MREGFLSWYARHSDIELVRHPEVDFDLVHRDFQQAILAAGGDEQCIQECDETLHWETFGCTKQKLYQALGVKYGDRPSLPLVAQMAIAMAEMNATEGLKTFMT